MVQCEYCEKKLETLNIFFVFLLYNFHIYRIMSKLNNDIPILLREKLGENFDPKWVISYDYSTGYWVEDDDSWDCPIRDYIDDPIIDISIRTGNESAYCSVRIIKSKTISIAEGAFDELHQWLKDKFGNQYGEILREHHMLERSRIDDEKREQRFLNANEINYIQRVVKEDLLLLFGERQVYKETWSRDTGHMWDSIRWIDEKPTEAEKDYADLENRKLVQLKNLSKNEFLKVIFEIASFGGKG